MTFCRCKIIVVSAYRRCVFPIVEVEMKIDIEEIILDEIIQAVAGIATQHRTKARRAKMTSVRVSIPFSEIHKSLKSRLDGMRGHVDPDIDMSALDEIPDSITRRVEAIYIDTPTIEALRDIWLPRILGANPIPDIVITEDALEMTVDVPPPRKIR